MGKYQNVEGLELKNLSIPGRLGRGFSGYFYETTWGGKKCVRKDFPLGSEERNRVFEREVKRICKLDDHPNVVKCFSYTLGRNSCSLVQEYVADNLENSVQRRIDEEVIRKRGASTPGSSRVLNLDEIKRLVSSRGKRKEKGKSKVADAGAFEAVPEAADIISQIATGMRHLHENGVVHGDLKPRNVLLLNSDQSGGWKVKLADYGLTETKKRIRMFSERARRAEIRTWKAPECLGKKNLNDGSLDDEFLSESDTDSDEETDVEFFKSKSAMADVYSFGLTCSYVLGRKPMSSDMILTQLRRQRMQEIKSELPESASLDYLKFMIGACLEPDPMKRPTFAMICMMEGRRRESVPQMPIEIGLSGSLQDRSVGSLEICNTMSASSGAPREVSHSSGTSYERRVASQSARLLLGCSVLPAMSTGPTRTAEEVFYQRLRYRAVNPLEHQLQCLDVFIKIEQTLAQRVRSIFSSRMRPLMRVGSMLDVKLMADESKWRSAEAKSKLGGMQKGLDDCENFLWKRSSHPDFQREELPRLDLSFLTSKGVVLWLASVAGIDLGKEESLSCTLDGLTAASVEYATICSWVMDRDWSPNIPYLEMTSSDWSKDRRRARKLWIVTEVLYATKLTVAGRQGLFNGVMAQASIGAPGLGVEAGAEIAIHRIGDTTLELRAKRNKQFIVGYRTMRVEYNPDGSVVLLRKAEDTGLRGDDDDPYQRNLTEMGEDIFEVDEDEENVVIPLLTPTDQELHDFRSRVADFDNSQAVIGSATIKKFGGDARVGDVETCKFQFPIADLEAVSRLIEGCVTLTDLTFQPGATDVVLENLHTFQVLDLTLNGPLENAIGGLLTGNPTLESCTLRIRPSETVLRAILTPFMFHRVGEKEKALAVKKLVLVNAAPNPQPPSLERVLAQVIEHNTLLEHLEVGDDVVAADNVVIRTSEIKANAIRCSRSLKVLRLQCTIADFKVIVAAGGLVPSGRTSNTTLSTLRVSLRDFVSVPARGGVVENYGWVADLAKLVESTRTLEHVEVSQDSAFSLLGRQPKQAAALKTKLREDLQRMCAARPRQSTSSTSSTSPSSTETRELRSVSVGWWKAVLVDDQWQITYTGPGEN